MKSFEKIVKLFIEERINPIIPFKHFGFIIIAILSDVEDLSRDGIENLSLQK